ncbi:DUF2062 domain-containing protein [Methylocaldum szegediense]|uniref:DUF2062 domain-containing protein n=1 Tax=Methylocaldum szegediense TaxID=73780 RepID=A0ABM9I0U1_9GAMM|nr:DUF2062 domain-containing protein [Methylocaldum szegediense]CAI8816550.1 DUF2062 domain-containing protein [Methylocaldum szegediense]
MPKKFLRRYLPDSKKIKEIKALEFLGDKLHSPNLLHLNRRSVSRAFAIGLWAMYTPPLPWQQIIAAVLAIYFNANLPIAVTLVWITNPLTWAPMYYFAYKIGAIVMGQTAFSFDKFSELFTVEKALELGAPLLVGCAILMHVGAVLGYFGIDFLWRRSVRHQWELRKFRNSKLNTAVLVRESHSSYKKLLEHRQKHEKGRVASLPRSARKKLT